MIFKATKTTILKAADLIKAGDVVAFPTETVYGLGASAYNPNAIAKIYAIKNRPSFNPLISHIAEVDFLKEYAIVDDRVLNLAKKFWPGPLTFILKRKDDNPALDLACAGLKKISVRMPHARNDPAFGCKLAHAHAAGELRRGGDHTDLLGMIQQRENSFIRGQKQIFGPLRAGLFRG